MNGQYRNELYRFYEKPALGKSEAISINKTIGFIGRGKCGMSLARYFEYKGLKVSGFSSGHNICGADSREPSDSAPPSEDCGSGSHITLLTADGLLKKSDIIFITVTDAAINAVWNRLKEYSLKNKIICHCSGSLSSDIFSQGCTDKVCSVHPMLAFSSIDTSIQAISEAFFTLEGGETALEAISEILNITGNKYKIISKENKAKYHAAACFASNFVVSVCEKSEELLTQCGFTRAEAHRALIPLMRNNMENIVSLGTLNAVTGPAARGDIITMEKHLSVLGADCDLYKMLSAVIFDMKSRND